jgi:tetratricopeptide (TPR) repeat protein
MGISCLSAAMAATGIDVTAGARGDKRQEADRDPDALYRDRESLASATAAAEIWAVRLAAAPADFESAWKLARMQYWLGTQGLPQARRRSALEQGVTAGRAAAELSPQRPEGHFWLAANMGALAESFGLGQGLKYRKPVKDALELVRALDPGFLQGSADRALGRWYLRVPALLGGSTRKSEAHLRQALSYDADSIITRVYLAETLEALGQRDAARQELRRALSTPLHPEWTPEDKHFKQQAASLLERLSR